MVLASEKKTCLLQGSVPLYRSKIQLLRTVLRIFRTDETQKVQIVRVIAFMGAKLLHDGCTIHDLNLNLGIQQSGNMVPKSPEKCDDLSMMYLWRHLMSL